MTRLFLNHHFAIHPCKIASYSVSHSRLPILPSPSRLTAYPTPPTQFPSPPPHTASTFPSRPIPPIPPPQQAHLHPYTLVRRYTPKIYSPLAHTSVMNICDLRNARRYIHHPISLVNHYFRSIRIYADWYTQYRTPRFRGEDLENGIEIRHDHDIAFIGI
jgi:hypothetical protein